VVRRSSANTPTIYKGELPSMMMDINRDEEISPGRAAGPDPIAKEKPANMIYSGAGSISGASDYNDTSAFESEAMVKKIKNLRLWLIWASSVLLVTDLVIILPQLPSKPIV
jgi:hypothetical protein